MAMAAVLAQRSTCRRLHVGALITDVDGLQVLGIGYNGNASGLPNICDDEETPGRCGCIHAELNALLKAPGTIVDKVLYTTTAPCEACAKLILNSRVSRVVYGDDFRLSAGVTLLERMGIPCSQAKPWLGSESGPAGL